MAGRSKSRGRSRITSWRALTVVAAMAVVGTGCGQIGGVHGEVGPGANIDTVAAAARSPLPSAEGQPTGDAGGVQGPTITGDSTILGAPTPSRKLITTITTTTSTQLANQQFTIPTNISNKSGPLYTCPVQGQFYVGDSFGADRFAGGYHPHAGNDMFAAEGTPIVAPFPGVAEADPNTLGGNAVIVRGQDGYVYNAHLSAYGRLGDVHTGDVIGYVGNTGDAQGTATHDHFEWHPYNGQPFTDSNGNQWVGPYGYSVIDTGSYPAVDPFPFLREACSS